VKEANNSQDCCIQTSVQDQPIETSSVVIGARIRKFDVDKFYQENFNKYLYYRWIQQCTIPRRSNSFSFHGLQHVARHCSVKYTPTTCITTIDVNL
jgi:hypothetical protein